MLEKEELLQITGGGTFSVGAIIGTIVTFLVGVVDGYINPKKCNS